MTRKQRNQLPKGVTVYLLETYVTNKDGTWSNYDQYFYYKKDRKIWQEEGLNVAPLMRPPSKEPVYQTYTQRQRQRSMKAVVDKYYSDAADFNVFGEVDINLTELGSL